ncbi:MAG TPA: PBP1A family penicillin-binding protein [Vicinamibacteria bacterium]|nr:PBP1A family penicillin-binding protein [Vicinamibacteria bacterium]
MGWITEARTSVRTFAESARSSLLSPGAGAADIALRTALFVVVIGGALVVGWTAKQAWAVHRLTRGVGNTVFYGADGKSWFALDEHRRDVPLAEVAPVLREAVIAVEDHRFYRHGGIDPIGFGRAVSRNIRRRTIAEGGSTITQQLARTLFLSTQRTIWRKAKEAVLAVLIEQQLTKDQILELYLNRVALSAGTFGVEAMSRQLYGKRAKDLGLLESAIVAGLIRAPSALSPWSNEEGALSRSRVVLARMRQEGFISAAAEQGANAARVRMTSAPHLADAHSGYAKEYLRQAFRDEVGDDDPPDWDVHTTFLPAVQLAAERAVEEGLARLGKRGLQAALVALDPETGDIVAMVGGRNYNASPYNRAVRSRRQPGSAFKPFVYAAALDHGLSPVTVLDSLHSVTAPGKQEWSPRNAEEGSPDEATLREALLESNNQAAVALQLRIGSGAVLSLASDLGLRDQPNVPSLALGSGLVTPMELAAAYAAFPNGGLAVAPRAIVRVLDASGGLVVENAVRRKRVLPEAVAFQTVTMLRDVVDVGTASSARSLGVRGPAGGKTGTTSEFKDAWFVGFTTSVVAAVWVGFDQPEPIGSEAFGARVALPIWADFMRRVAGALPADEFPVPSGLREVELCRVSYLRPVDGCPTYVEFFKEGDDIPHRLCPIHQGSLKQEARRALDGIFSRVGKKILDIFR